MEAVFKTIVTESAKNRFEENKMDTCNSYPKDVVINEGDVCGMFNLVDKLPILHEKDKYVFRYRNIIDVKIWLTEFIRKCKFYKRVRRFDLIKWIEVKHDFYSDDIFNIYSSLSVVDEPEICDIVCINNEAELFNTYFRIEGDMERYELRFMEFVDTIFKNEHKYALCNPFFNVPLYIDANADTVGEYGLYSQNWVPEKRYYINDIVLYNDEYYVLTFAEKCESVKITGEFYNYIKERPSEYIYVESIDDVVSGFTNEKCYILVENDSNSYYFLSPYYDGYFNEEKKVWEFDEEHWSKLEPVITSSENDTDIYNGSELDRFVSFRRSYDENGKVLPYIFDENGVYLIYLLGYTNYTENDNGALVDLLKSVTFYKGDEPGETIAFPENRRIPVPNNTDYDTIEFTYFVGAKVSDGVCDEGTGVRYVEKRRINFKMDGEGRIYIVIYSSPLNTETEGIGSNVASIDFNTNTDKFYEIGAFVDDRLFGVSFINDVDSDSSVDRGGYAAFERHNILGEVNSLNDLENYRNNYFKL